jgi:septal ring factor EnvC (AmiA/AmiB activator)
MGVFKKDTEYKRVIFNIRMELAERLERAKADAGELDRKLDVEGAINKSLEQFLKKAEKKIEEMKTKRESRKDHSSPNEDIKRDMSEEKELRNEEERNPGEKKS